MATSTPRRAQPATHPTVYVGLALALAGLLVAMYAYTGTRIYDLTYAYIALGGGVLALLGILTSAWGRAVMASRAQRARRGFDAPRPSSDEAPPTVAVPRAKRTLKLPPMPRFGRKAEAPQPAADASMFSFRRRSAPPPSPPAEPSPAAAALPAQQVEVETVPAAPQTPPEEAPIEVAPMPAGGAVERITMRCPRCANEFTAEGVRPIAVSCPSCGLAGTV